MPPTVAVALAEAQNVTHLETAINVRTEIGRAEGLLMERLDLSPAEAFAVLRRVSQDRNIKLNPPRLATKSPSISEQTLAHSPPWT